MLLLLVTFNVKSLLSILSKSRGQCRSTKSVYHNIISELKLQDRYDYQKYFSMNSETNFLIPCLRFSLN